jgi:histone acetyltransferase (RNA polymerase elongator complex component)
MSSVTVPFFISQQGCPHTCIFCDQPTISGSAGRLPDRDQILARIRAWQSSSGNRPLEVAFFGGTFSALPRPVQQLLLSPLQPLLATGEVASVRISTRPDSIDRETVLWLAGQGVGTIEVGVQSMDDAVLQAAGRGHSAAASGAAISCIKECGLSAGAQLMPGLPGDTPALALESLERVISAGADFVRLYPVLVIRGTELARRYLTGEYRPLSVDEGVALCKQLLLASLRAGVDVIRIGLQADQGLNRESVLDGCLHPALGQLVRSELFFDLLLQLVSGLPETQGLTVSCHPGRLSDLIGQKRKNLTRLAGLGFEVARVLPDQALTPYDVMVSGFDNCTRGNVIDDLPAAGLLEQYA